MNCLFVFAGSNKQFDNWCHSQQVSRRDPRFRYLRYGDVRMLLEGTINQIVIRVGNWYERKDCVELERVLAERTRPSQSNELVPTHNKPHGAEPSEICCDDINKFDSFVKRYASADELSVWNRIYSKLHHAE